VDYHNGDIMWQPINVYILWLGRNFTASQKDLVKKIHKIHQPSSRCEKGPLKAPLSPCRHSNTVEWPFQRRAVRCDLGLVTCEVWRDV